MRVTLPLLVVRADPTPFSARAITDTARVSGIKRHRDAWRRPHRRFVSPPAPARGGRVRAGGHFDSVFVQSASRDACVATMTAQPDADARMRCLARAPAARHATGFRALVLLSKRPRAPFFFSRSSVRASDEGTTRASRSALSPLRSFFRWLTHDSIPTTLCLSSCLARAARGRGAARPARQAGPACGSASRRSAPSTAVPPPGSARRIRHSQQGAGASAAAPGRFRRCRRLRRDWRRWRRALL